MASYGACGVLWGKESLPFSRDCIFFTSRAPAFKSSKAVMFSVPGSVLFFHANFPSAGRRDVSDGLIRGGFRCLSLPQNSRLDGDKRKSQVLVCHCDNSLAHHISRLAQVHLAVHYRPSFCDLC